MGTMTITTTGAQDARIVAAFGTYLGLPGNATAAQVRAEVYNFIRLTVRAQEEAAAVEAARASALAGITDLGSAS